MSKQRTVDLLYLAKNRLEFTRETFTALLANTDWQYVHELFVYDDGSVDGTDEWLERAAQTALVPVRFMRTSFASPVAAMVDFIEAAQAPILAKTDNDAMLPPGWLEQSLRVLDRHPELMLLGIEAMYPHVDDPQVLRSYVSATFISGLGLYRREAFARSRPRPFNVWFGMEDWQMAQGPQLVRGWINPALPVFLLDRVPFAPWSTYTDRYVRSGWQRRWPRYDPTCTLWHWHWPDRATTTHPAPSLQSGDARFLCAMRIKNEAGHIQEVISRVLPLCERVFVFDDHSSDGTGDICRSFGDRCSVFPSPFEGLDEARDKNFLLQHVLQAGPEWVLWLDGDEVLERTGPEKLRAAAERSAGVAAYSLRIAYVWNDPQHIRVDGIYGRFFRPSFFRLTGQPADRLAFRPTQWGGNLHCGNVPGGLVGNVRQLNVRLKHLGYVTKQQRQAKYLWYTSVDPNNEAEDNYRHLAEIPNARFAPGPPQVVAWTE